MDFPDCHFQFYPEVLQDWLATYCVSKDLLKNKLERLKTVKSKPNASPGLPPAGRDAFVLPGAGERYNAIWAKTVDDHPRRLGLGAGGLRRQGKQGDFEAEEARDSGIVGCPNAKAAV
jgi:hypothetical protein